MNSNNDIAWPSYARIVNETGLSKSTVAKYLKILDEEGWIERDSGDSTTNTVYIASLPKNINDAVKEFDNTIQKHLKGSASDGLRSAPDGQGVVRETDTNIQLNKQDNKQEKNTDIFQSEKRQYFIEELPKDDYQNCNEMIQVMIRVGGFYTGKLSIDEWNECEFNMSDCDCFDHASYLYWWKGKHQASMRKTPALPNIVCDMNGIPFSQFYDSTFLQEAD